MPCDNWQGGEEARPAGSEVGRQGACPVWWQGGEDLGCVSWGEEGAASPWLCT